MDFKSYLKTAAQEIDQELDEFFKKWSEDVKAISPKLIGLNNTFIQACEGGKRLRGALVKLGYELTADSTRQTAMRCKRLAILKPAAAFEIFQTAILAHDDVIDQSPLRRGKPTIYKSLGENHYAISQTICLGDIGFFLAEKLIEESDFPAERKVKALASFIETILQTGLGQMLDIELPSLQDAKSEEDVLTVFRLKTARYTLVGPLHLGIVLGGGDQELLDNAQEFGESLGIAFQIQDDILGVFGSAEQTGKSVTSDVEEGKITLLYLHALKNASAQQSKTLEDYYGKGRIDKEEFEKIKKVFIDTGALEYSQKKAEELVLEAKKLIPQLTTDHGQQSGLSEMADFLVKRNN